MGDYAIVAREQLQDALNGISVTVSGSSVDHKGDAYGTLRYPASVAEMLFDDFEREMKKRFTAPPVILPRSASPGDPELEALNVIVTEMARLAVLGEYATVRVMRYLAERYLT